MVENSSHKNDTCPCPYWTCVGDGVAKTGAEDEVGADEADACAYVGAIVAFGVLGATDEVGVGAGDGSEERAISSQTSSRANDVSKIIQ